MGTERAKLYITPDGGAKAGRDIFLDYPPPYVLTADMLFVGGLMPTRPLRQAFPRTPFLDLAGSTPLVAWFSRVRSFCYSRSGGRECLDESAGFGYNELTVIVLLRRRGVFVPGLYATGDFSPRLGRRYGMPKVQAPVEFSATTGRVWGALDWQGASSRASANVLASGRLFALPFALPTPWWSWPASFPSGSFVSARFRRVPRFKLAHVEGSLELPVPWLQRSIRFWSLGAFVPGLVMELPGPPSAVPEAQARSMGTGS